MKQWSQKTNRCPVTDSAHAPPPHTPSLHLIPVWPDVGIGRAVSRALDNAKAEHDQAREETALGSVCSDILYRALSVLALNSSLNENFGSLFFAFFVLPP